MMNKKIITKAFKYIVILLILAYTVALLIMTGGSNKSFKSISKALDAVVDQEKLSKAQNQYLKRYYGLNGSDYDGVSLYVSTTSMSAEELLLIKAKSEEQVARIQETIEERKETRKQDFEGYAPDEADLVDASVLQIRGKYVFFAISKDAAKYKKTFTDSL